MSNARIMSTLAALKRNEALYQGKPHVPKKRKAWKMAKSPQLAPGRDDPKLNLARFVQALRSRTHSATKRKGSTKAAKTIEMLGCSIREFREHITSLFAVGMSWDNYGDWELDHVKPCRAFDLTQPAEQKECFHYTNLQPMWREENKRKSDNWKGLSARKSDLFSMTKVV